MYQTFTDSSNYTNWIGTENSGGAGIIGTGVPFAFVIGTLGSHPIKLFTQGVSRVTIQPSGDVNATQSISANAGFQVSTSGSQPICDSTRRGLMWNVEGASGVSDVMQVCIKNAADAYVWTNL